MGHTFTSMTGDFLFENIKLISTIAFSFTSIGSAILTPMYTPYSCTKLQLVTILRIKYVHITVMEGGMTRKSSRKLPSIGFDGVQCAFSFCF